ncbi:DUF927 domain-containing protein [Caldibacillus thermoamylovorans]|uniref:DUF927 domain-containing protein n=1 Tax=Caldibacillus thermoamylovorans TaxID=35841 RepID=UPI00203B6EA4|nr:DUF927 domain-containing protein [Caldibacillus thermoamylovorans]MCM3478949.1 DUF927 domain-containing protein [Caldibacillus thermoamylovorans]
MALKKVRRPVKQESEKHAEANHNVGRKVKPLKKPTSNHDIEVPPYQIKGNDLLVWNEKQQQYVFVSKAVKINSIKRNIETKDIQIELAFWAYDKWETITINRGELNKRDLKKLVSKGMDIIQDSQASHVFTFLSKQEKQLKPVNIHTGIGWDVIDGELVYKHYTIAGTSLESIFEGELNIKPIGSYNDYLNLLMHEVIGHAPLELAICLGISSLIIGMLNCAGVAELDTLWVHLPGKSSTGKTTAAMLFASIAGCPSIKDKGGLVQSFNGTKNALSNSLVGNNGVPIVLDEFSMNQMSSEALSSFLYEISQNRGRLRLNKDSERKEPGSWSTTVLSTGENSIISRVNQNEGLRVRLFEFPRIQWTKNAENAERLKSGLLKNYGFIAPIMANKMIEYGPLRILNMLNDNKEELIEMLPQNRLTSRIAQKLAQILTAAELFEETFKIRLSADELIQMLIDQEKESMTEREMAPKFYKQLRQYIIQYVKNFKIQDKPPTPYQEIWGKIENHSGKTYCYILPVIFNKIAKEFNFTDTRVLLNELKSMDFLVHDKNKTQKKKLIFSKDEVHLREELTGKTGFAEKGDYTICIVYEDELFKELIN